MVWVVRATFRIFSAWSKWFPVTTDDHGQNLVTSLWPGDKATIKGVVAWQVTPSQKILSAKIRWKSSRLNFLGSRWHPPHWLSSIGPNYRPGVLLISAGANEGHFEGKMSWESHQWGRHLQPRRNWPTWASNVLSPILFSRSGPVGLPPVPWTEKTIERSFFVQRGGHCCCGDLAGRTTFEFFLSVLQKSDQRAKKCTELRGEYVE